MKNFKKVSCVIPTMNRADDVMECIRSIWKSDYKNVEIVIVDDASTDDTVKRVENLFNRKNNVELIVSDKSVGAAEARNIGVKKATGDYLLFVDSDNVIDPKMIGNLVKFLEDHDDCVMVGPLMLYKDDPGLIWLYSADLNMYTAQAYYKGNREKDVGQYPEIVEVGHIPNCFMVRRDQFEEVGMFDGKLFIMFEESDLSHRMKKRYKGKIYIYTKARTYHNAPIQLDVKRRSRDLLSSRIYRTARNKVYFMKKHSTWIQFSIFVTVFLPLFVLYYQFRAIKTRRIYMGWYYLKGSIMGFLM